jgi:drug/metabolite transporter (DMT)-like permease
LRPAPEHQRHSLRALPVKGLGAVTIWGASFVATRVALRALDPFALVAVRLLAGAALLALVVRVRSGRLLPARSDLPVGVLLGCVLSLHLLMQAYGLEKTTAINTGWIVGFMPVTIALGAHLLHQQRLRQVGWLGVGVGTGGVLLVTMTTPPDFKQARIGDLLQIASCLTWTIYTLAGAGPVTRNGALRITLFSMAVAGGVAASVVAYYLWYSALDQYGPARVGSLLYLEPFVALATGAVLLHEPVMPNALAGGLCVLAGVWFVAKGS